MPSSQNTNQLTYLSEPKEFEELNKLYIKVRDKENRLLSDAVVSRLPFISVGDNHNFKVWKARAKSFKRLQNYLLEKETPLNVLDLGCGNGWLAANLAFSNKFTLTGLDVNEYELQQATRVFKKSNLTYCFGDVFKNFFPTNSFDVIILNACAQYFDDLSKLINQLFYYLKPNGEIHIIDTPFYKTDEIESAKKRSINYYSFIGFPEMAQQYYHHSLTGLSGFKFELLRKNNFITQAKAKLFGDVPANFVWVKITT